MNTMRCGMIMFTIHIELFVLSIVVTASLTKMEQLAERSVFEYEQKFEAARNWTAILCRTAGRPSTLLLEVYPTNPSYETQNFFNVLTNYLYNTRPRCMNAILSSSYNMEYWPTKNVNLPWFGKSGDYCAPDLSILTPVPDVESFVFNNPMIARVIVMSLEAVDSLMEYEFSHWEHKQYVVILMIWKNDHEIMKLCIKNIKDMLKNITKNILETIWKKRGAYNFFIGFPLMRFHESKLWSYDPFYRDNITQNQGKIVEINPMTPPSPRRLRNLQGYNLDIGLFEAKLTAEVQSGKSYSRNYHPVIEDFHGVDGYIVQTMSKHFNFTVEIVPPSGGVKYGYVQNGTAVGTLGDVAYRRIHASFNSQYVKEYITENQQFTTSMDIEFTVPVDWDRVCIIVPSSEEIPRWLRTFIYMQPAIWTCLLVVLILATIVWHLFRNYHHSASRNYSKCHKNYLAVFIDTFMLLVGAPVRSTNVLGERILVGVLAFLGLTVMGAFTGTLYHSFTNEMYYRPIETLKELDALGLIVATSSPNLENIFGPKNPINESSTISRLARKIKSLPNNSGSTIRKTAYERNIAAIYREKVFLIEQHQYVDSKGRSLLHLVPDCPQAYYLAYLMPANSIFLESFNSMITALNEGGIILFWNKNQIQQSRNNNIKATVINGKGEILDEPKPFSIQDMEICFLILAFGLAVSIIVFMLEWIHMKKVKRIVPTSRIST